MTIREVSWHILMYNQGRYLEDLRKDPENISRPLSGIRTRHLLCSYRIHYLGVSFSVLRNHSASPLSLPEAVRIGLRHVCFLYIHSHAHNLIMCLSEAFITKNCN